MSQSHLNVLPVAITAPTKSPDKKKTELTFTFTPSADNVNLNLLILLHGLGDTEEPYRKLGINLKLPQTATMAIQAPEPVPYMDDGYQWFPSFDLLTGDMLTPADPNRMKGLIRTRALLSKLVQHLINDCSYLPSNIFFFGFSQGGTVALDQVLFGDHKNLGGVVSISGYLLEEQAHEKIAGDKFKGNILVTQGDNDRTIGEKRAAEKKLEIIKKYCDDSAKVSHFFVSGKDHSMPKSQLEWRAIHTFFSINLARRNIELENMSDVYLVSK
ncbi:Alpha/Beta hydrolase protein [Umbelopsis sp. PMI_123]|nr:Alpha/Beta hydrolase protein [Umbelopsis sp. PMI_123]